jgi:hypothetical protein
VRLPFVWGGLGMDEGGYAYVAQQWARGGRLYSSVWIDRPQGLVLAYRLLLLGLSRATYRSPTSQRPTSQATISDLDRDAEEGRGDEGGAI